MGAAVKPAPTQVSPSLKDISSSKPEFGYDSSNKPFKTSSELLRVVNVDPKAALTHILAQMDQGPMSKEAIAAIKQSVDQIFRENHSNQAVN